MVSRNPSIPHFIKGIFMRIKLFYCTLLGLTLQTTTSNAMEKGTQTDVSQLYREVAIITKEPTKNPADPRKHLKKLSHKNYHCYGACDNQFWKEFDEAVPCMRECDKGCCLKNSKLCQKITSMIPDVYDCLCMPLMCVAWKCGCLVWRWK